MARKKVTNLFLYRRRVGLAYAFIFAALVVLLGIALFVPGGLTQAEQNSSVHAVDFGIIGVNAPFYLLQKVSVTLLGLSAFSIKVPSVILGAILGVALFLLLKRWLSLSIAVFSSLIIFAGTTFLSLAGTGSPIIMYVLFPALLLFFGTRVLAHDRSLVFYAVLLVITIALALLTPTMIYLVILAICLAVFNPHVRYGFRRLPVTGFIVLTCGFIIAVAPLAYMVVMDPSTLQQILAIPGSLDIIGNLTNVIALFGNFLQPGLTGDMLTPLIGLPTAGLAILGLYRTIRGIYTARAQFIIGWSVIALILAVVSPGLGILLYLPVVLLASIGLGQLAAIWYRTFPLNPYARISALVPIGVLIAGIVIGSSLSYVNTTLYASGSSELYSHDLQILQHYFATAKPSNITLVVPVQAVSFYQNLHTSGLKAVVSVEDAADVTGPMITTKHRGGDSIPTRILTDGRAQDADRFYVYN